MWGKVYKSSELKSGREHCPNPNKEGAGDVPLYGQSKDESEPLWLSKRFLPTSRPKTLGNLILCWKDPPPHSLPEQHTLQASLIWSYKGVASSLPDCSARSTSMPNALIYLTHRAPFSETQSAHKPVSALHFSAHPPPLTSRPHSTFPPATTSKVSAKVKEFLSSKWEWTRECSSQGHLAVFQKMW